MWLVQNKPFALCHIIMVPQRLRQILGQCHCPSFDVDSCDGRVGQSVFPPSFRHSGGREGMNRKYLAQPWTPQLEGDNDLRNCDENYIKIYFCLPPTDPWTMPWELYGDQREAGAGCVSLGEIKQRQSHRISSL